MKTLFTLFLLLVIGCTNTEPVITDQVTGILDLPDDTAMSIIVGGTRCVVIMDKQLNRTKLMACEFAPRGSELKIRL